MIWVVTVSAGVIGFALGALVVRCVLSRKASGDLRIDTSDPDDGPYMFLELSEPPRNIMRKEYVTLKVKVANFISQK